MQCSPKPSEQLISDLRPLISVPFPSSPVFSPLFFLYYPLILSTPQEIYAAARISHQAGTTEQEAGG